jgi:hypothetical protein
VNAVEHPFEHRQLDRLGKEPVHAGSPGENTPSYGKVGIFLSACQLFLLTLTVEQRDSCVRPVRHLLPGELIGRPAGHALE